jgi:hypothetical protein
MRFPFSKEEIEQKLSDSPEYLFDCWICLKVRGKHLYAYPLIAGGYALRIACDNCSRVLKRKGIFFYN